MTKTPQVVRADEAYTIPELRRRLGIGDYTMRQMRKSGLRVIEITPRRRVIRGVDFLKWCEQRANGET